jgi:hypothetical protein
VPKKIQAADPIREATLDALKQIVDALLELLFEAGVTVQQFNGASWTTRPSGGGCATM